MVYIRQTRKITIGYIRRTLKSTIGYIRRAGKSQLVTWQETVPLRTMVAPNLKLKNPENIKKKESHTLLGNREID